MRVLEIVSASPTQAKEHSARNTGPTIFGEAAEPTLDAVVRAKCRRWNWLGHAFSLEENPDVRKY